jgi:hypothetical protein
MAIDIEVVHKATGSTRFEQALAVLVGLAAVVAGVLGVQEVDANKRQEQAQARAVRVTIEVFGTLAGSAPRPDAAGQAQIAAILLTLQGHARNAAAALLPATAGFESALAAADLRAADDLKPTVDAIGAPPEAASGVDPTTRTVVASTPEDGARLLQRQSRELATADRFGTRGSRAVFGISILALAVVLFGLGAVLGEAGRGRVILATGAVALTAAAACAVAVQLV